MGTRIKNVNPSDIVLEFMIGKHDMATTVYMSPDPYFEAFEEIIDLHRFDLATHQSTGLCLAAHDGRLFLGSMQPGTPGAKIPCWRSHIKGAWLIKIYDINVSTINKAHVALATAASKGPLDSSFPTRSSARTSLTMACPLCLRLLSPNKSMIR
jgi:hypothetical protein